ncbi:hypothetical protein COS31_04240 [Candidatus Roizmanbacteria bacterium CG02_land_8_20_14_3_00_36_15]|uniref:Serine aminopeptidase S33 domain-containing protein n=1 Tax=Candidatus Roizmanbacteria bacterium CG10_big_fil_rev_8_21_14_0_10_36_26 TaxID=1974851 RepID=A0A2M8KL73_9BACT|nr:MAG: hypothetical protein COS31_04240 [Candidatus Roizmanbacteria bacterium CG02_land_8_20_14_3_00_36_15]PIY69839.1 MAG: hypothetical protein COY89_04325 [Candidatus Roizmanbacteria bacterium CG_4_10_14_0_8_um_filter_36_36]PJA53218.1 MAG: hypothetical protein CO166_02620 [Candidatus Roizmanbacteria bacterium CG_4_9_14_3_um_filter_36_11]PJE60665.1 MAG: hypothetical protein COU86_03065 [Candidatus Roizmanbacteria bacterium CG10_big_fil_rev_8_21_14_0_10_36_26]
MKKIFFSSTDKLKLCGVWHTPSKKTSKAIVLAHGISVDKDEEGGNFIKLANLLSGAGYAVFRFDFRGNGESEGDPRKMTIKEEVDDLPTLAKNFKEPATPH